MEKLKLSKRDVKAVKDSIAHWKRDVLAKLKKGVLIKDYLRLTWADNMKKVKCYSSSCPLCRIYYDGSETIPCVACPYYKKYDISCLDVGVGARIGHWREFRNKPCPETCNGMIKALENILK